MDNPYQAVRAVLVALAMILQSSPTQVESSSKAKPKTIRATAQPIQKIQEPLPVNYPEKPQKVGGRVIERSKYRAVARRQKKAEKKARRLGLIPSSPDWPDLQVEVDTPITEEALEVLENSELPEEEVKQIRLFLQRIFKHAEYTPKEELRPAPKYIAKEEDSSTEEEVPEEEPEEESTEIDVEGSWGGVWGPEHISSEYWEDSWAGYKIHEYNNELNFCITQNAHDAEYRPLSYNKVVWTEITEHMFHYCVVSYGEDSIESAKQSPNKGDATNLESGCFGFPWTTLARQ